MPKFRHWILSLGIAAAPGLVYGGPFSFTSKAPQQAVSGNQQVANQIADALRSAKFAGSNINISYGGGVATLTGTIGDMRQKTQATALADRVKGVNRVDNQLTVPSPSGFPASNVTTAGFRQTNNQRPQFQQVAAETPAPTQSAAPAPTNQQIANQIGASLKQANLGHEPIEIRFTQGTATLAGRVSTDEQKATAKRVASGVPGVSYVDDSKLRVAAKVSPVAFQPATNAAQPPAAGQPMPPMNPMPPNGMPPGMAPGMMAPGMGGMPAPMSYGFPGAAPGQNPAMFNNPYLPGHAWPGYAQYPNSAAIQYPKQYSASAWPYIGPFYPYPQVPLGWRKVQLEWDDGHWQLDFDSKTDRWFWFLNPSNW